MKDKAEKYLDDNKVETVIIDTGNKTHSVQLHKNGKQITLEQVLADFATSHLPAPLSDEEIMKQLDILEDNYKTGKFIDIGYILFKAYKLGLINTYFPDKTDNILSPPQAEQPSEVTDDMSEIIERFRSHLLYLKSKYFIKVYTSDAKHPFFIKPSEIRLILSNLSSPKQLISEKECSHIWIPYAKHDLICTKCGEVKKQPPTKNKEDK